MIIQEVADEVLEAFREYNLTPVRGKWLDFNRCACAVGSLMVKHNAHITLLSSQMGSDQYLLFNEVNMDVINRLSHTYGLGFVDGLVAGFDGDDDIDDEEFNIEYFSNGYDTGKYIWNKLNQGA